MPTLVDNNDEAMIQSLWADEECLDLDSVQYGTGEVVLLEAPDIIPDATTSIQIQIKERTTIRAAAQLPGVTLRPGLAGSATPQIVLERVGLRITGGECAGYGTFGWVAVSRNCDDYLVWLAFFQNSNPFSALSLDGEEVVATTNLGAKYVFPLNKPEQVRVIAS